jgi:hypothetical protein
MIFKRAKIGEKIIHTALASRYDQVSLGPSCQCPGHIGVDVAPGVLLLYVVILLCSNIATFLLTSSYVLPPSFVMTTLRAASLTTTTSAHRTSHPSSTQGLKNRHRSENRTEPILSVSLKTDKPVKTGTKFKLLKSLNQIGKLNRNLINRPVLPVYRTGFEQN